MEIKGLIHTLHTPNDNRSEDAEDNSKDYGGMRYASYDLLGVSIGRICCCGCRHGYGIRVGNSSLRSALDFAKSRSSATKMTRAHSVQVVKERNEERTNKNSRKARQREIKKGRRRENKKLEKKAV